MIDVSIIVPLYKGEKYIDSIIRNVELSVSTAEIFAEIIFVNDYPNEKMKYREGELCKCIFLNNERNLGIHASRVHGLVHSSGEYIVFLDQDDFIDAEYLISQLENIKDADASVCRLINGDREHYTDSFKLEDVVTKEFMMSKWCSIVSPGQVLIRKSSIPDIWITNIVNSNGADDYFLWLSMFMHNCKFNINNKILFKHTVSGFNTSCDTNLMMDSEREVINILKKSELFDVHEKEKFDELIESLRRIHIRQLDNVYVAFCIQNWLKNADYDYLFRLIGSNVGIYGAADIGTVLYDGLKTDARFKLCFIDRNAEYIKKEIPIYTIDNIPGNLDSIIIAVREKGVVIKIMELLSRKINCRLLGINELIN